MNVTIDDLVTWELGVDGPLMVIQNAYASWLQNPSLMPQGVAEALAAAGLTTADYEQILSCDPFTSGNQEIDSNRFVPVSFSFPYEPPASQGDTPPTQTLTMNSGTTSGDTTETQVQYEASASVHGLIGDVLNLGASGSLQWTNTSTSTQITGSSQSATVTIGGPAFGYTGPTELVPVFAHGVGCSGWAMSRR